MGRSSAYEDKMKKTLDVLAKQFAAVRAGRANPAILDKVRVDYYGTPTPVNQVAAVSVSEAHTLVIQPWDVSVSQNIVKAIEQSDLGINPQNDGKLIRLNFPSLNEERRHDLVKTIHKYAEESKVSIRAIRRDALDSFKNMKKKSEMTEDELAGEEKSMQDLTDKYCKKIDEMFNIKEKDIMAI